MASTLEPDDESGGEPAGPHAGRRRSAASVVAWIAIWAGAAFPGAAVAADDPPPIRWEVRWVAHDPCPEETAVLEAVAAYVGGERLASGPSPNRFLGTITGSDHGYSLAVRTGAPEPNPWKTIEADDCGVLAQAYALMVAFAIDPAFASEHPELGAREGPPGTPQPAATLPTEQPSSDGAAPPGRPELASPTRRALPPQRARPVRRPPPRHASATPRRAAASPSASGLKAGAGGAAAAGVLPLPSFAVGGLMAWDDAVRFELSGWYWFVRHVPVEQGTIGGTSRIGLAVVEPAVCLPGGARYLAGCVGASVGEMRARGITVPHPTLGRSWWVTPLVGVGAAKGLSRDATLRGRFSLGIPIFRPAFVVEDPVQGEPARVFRPAALSLFLGVVLEARVFTTDPSSHGHNP